MARIFGKKLEQVLGQPVVIESRTGAGGNIAAESVARAAPDGHTLLLANSGILSANASLYKKINFDPVKDFAPITLVGAQANVLVVHPSVPAHTLAELIAYAKANPGKMNFASGGHGSSPHLAAELLKARAGIDIAHVSYRGTGLALQDLVGGHVQMMFSSVSPVIGHLQNGSLRALAVSTLARTALLPDVPTIAELGFPGFEATAWHALVAPAATPKDAIATVSSGHDGVIERSGHAPGAHQSRHRCRRQHAGRVGRLYPVRNPQMGRDHQGVRHQARLTRGRIAKCQTASARNRRMTPP